MNTGEILIYKAPDGNIKIDVCLESDTVWLTQEQMALLFGKGRSTITEHIRNVFAERELQEEVVCRKFRHTTQHGAIATKTQEATANYYNPDVIISVGYRVKSHQGTQFRIWATQRLREYIIKGFALNDERFKLLWAISQHNAAELIYRRIDTSLPLLGMQSYDKKNDVTIQ